MQRETIKNRKAVDDLIRKQARAGDPICSSLLELESFAHHAGGGASFMATTAYDWRNEDAEDDLRPY